MMPRLLLFQISRPRASSEENQMKKLNWVVLSLLLVFGTVVSGQNSNTNKNTNKPKPSRGPIFRANADQVKQAQATLKQRTFYSGEPTGKLDDATRAGLKKYQEAEGLKVTGTLNKLTLEKMNITLTDKQKSM
jgi:peptidoglycan hydrolase-like protein with peptidoglycan-binding domain